MARYRNFTRRLRGYKQNRIWLPGKINMTTEALAQTDSPDNRTWLLAKYEVPSAEVDHVIERMRGQIVMSVRGTNAQIPGIIFATVLPDSLYTGNIGELVTAPDLLDPDGQQDFPLVMDACVPKGQGTALATGADLPIDSKAKRRVRKGDAIMFFFRTLDSILPDTSNPGTAQFIFKGAIRILLKLAS